MKKEHSKYQWIIGICCSENDGVKLYKYTGTVKKMKKRLLRLIKEDKKNDKENWESGSETVAELSDESMVKKRVFVDMDLIRIIILIIWQKEYRISKN